MIGTCCWFSFWRQNVAASGTRLTQIRHMHVLCNSQVNHKTHNDCNICMTNIIIIIANKVWTWLYTDKVVVNIIYATLLTSIGHDLDEMLHVAFCIDWSMSAPLCRKVAYGMINPIIKIPACKSQLIPMVDCSLFDALQFSSFVKTQTNRRLNLILIDYAIVCILLLFWLPKLPWKISKFILWCYIIVIFAVAFN